MELETDNHNLHEHLSTIEEEHNLSHQITKKKSKGLKASGEKVSFHI